MIKVNLRFYGMISDMIGKDHDLIDAPLGTTVSELFEKNYGNIFTDTRPQISFAINNSICNHDTIVSHDDTIDIMPPFAGG